MEQAGIVLLACHLLADFPLQTDWMASEKFDDVRALLAHLGVHILVTMPSMVVLYGADGALATLFVVGVHGAIDTRRWADPKEGFEAYPIWVDQSLHVASIALAVVCYG